MGISEEKAALRTRYRRERNERYIPHSFEYLVDISEIRDSQVIASYISYGDEPDTSALNRALITNGKTLLVPRINGEKLDWVQWNGKPDTLRSNKKIQEPIGDAFSDTDSIDVAIVPALRIDRNGFRLGQGGGFYDRALADSPAWTIGLIHPDEITSTDLPREPWDIAINAAATPDLVTRFKR
jgi:5-formyltetrahydrofolate cyclo-ligase